MTDREIYVWLAIVGLMAVTFLARSSLILWPRDIQIPARLQRALRFAPMAAIAAIIVPSVLLQQGEFSVGPFLPKIAAVAGLFVAWRLSRQMAIALLVGLLVYVVSRLSF